MSLPSSRRRLLFAAVALAILVIAALAARFWLGGYALRTMLTWAGASDIRYAAVRATPWRIEADELRFQIGTHEIAVGRLTMNRARWWAASLGDVRVERAEVAAVLDQSDLDPWNWSTYDNGLQDEPVNLPFQTLDFEGRLIVRMAGLPDMPIAIQLEGRPKGQASWIGSLVADGPGFSLAGAGALLRAGQELDFQVHHAELELEPWAQHIQRLIVLPGAPWEMAGKLTGVAEGRVTAKRFAATARVNLRDGRMKADGEDISAHGAEAELEFSDLWKYRTKSGLFRLGELRVGRLALREITADFGLWGRELRITRAAFVTLGGRGEVDAFRYELGQREASLTVRVQDIDFGELRALTTGLPALPPGRLAGVLPLRLHSHGVRLDAGTLDWRADGPTEMILSAPALLRSGAALDEPSLRALKAAGTDSVPVRLERMQLEIRPADIPLGSSARVRFSGGTANGPVEARLVVNGAVERYLDVMRGSR